MWILTENNQYSIILVQMILQDLQDDDKRRSFYEKNDE